MGKLSDNWQTPDWLFKQLDEEFHFDIDLCATTEDSKCGDWYDNYLTNKRSEDNAIMEGYRISYNRPFDNSSCFMNPPYSNPKPFIEKAWEESKYCKIVCLVKCDPSTRWWATFWNYAPRNGCINCYGKDYMCKWCTDNNIKPQDIGTKPGCQVRFFPKRIKFDPPQQLIDSGEVWKIGNTYYTCYNKLGCKPRKNNGLNLCLACKFGSYRKLSGPTFSSALLIFDRRGL